MCRQSSQASLHSLGTTTGEIGLQSNQQAEVRSGALQLIARRFEMDIGISFSLVQVEWVELLQTMHQLSALQHRWHVAQAGATTALQKMNKVHTSCIPQRSGLLPLAWLASPGSEADSTACKTLTHGSSCANTQSMPGLS